MARIVEVRKLEGLKRTLSKLQSRIEDAADTAAEQTAWDVSETARSYAPVDSGELRDSIEVEELGEGHYAVGPRDDIEYALFVEWGTSTTPAQPYMEPTALGHQSDLRRNVTKEVRKVIRRKTR